MVRAEDGKWFCFSSSRLQRIETVVDQKSGKEKTEAVPEIVTLEKDGKQYQFVLAHISKHANKVVEIFPIAGDADRKAFEEAKAKAIQDSDAKDTVVDGYVEFDGTYYKEYRPFDLSITKNVLALLIAAVIVTLIVLGLARYYARHTDKTPRKGMGFVEMLVDFLYSGTIKSALGDRTAKFAPYLLTCFFFIFVMNLLGLVVIFPGGANLTGNIAVTLVLAVIAFVMINIHGSKHYWKDIFWPDVPWWLKFPLPIMQFIEIFSMFTKPAALCVRLFANMMGGHMIVITLILIIFIFAAFGAVAAGASVVVSILFTLFMLALDVLVSFIQAYVFTLLTTIFIAMSTETPHAHPHELAEHIDLGEEPSKV
ncbi:MAG: F0F1 ATP synthase subunit A [Muribaculaceae bacterium]|nr:F0F1 ATP synthase subunit A [Muribaculaceae bacterium]